MEKKELINKLTFYEGYLISFVEKGINILRANDLAHLKNLKEYLIVSKKHLKERKDNEIILIRKTKLINEIIHTLKKKLYLKEKDDNWILREYLSEVIEISKYFKIEKESCNELGCNECKNQKKFPKIHWSKVKCSALEYNKNQTKCINFNK